MQDISLKFASVGDGGKPAVLVHGLGGSSSIWWPQVAALRHEHRLLLPDLPGSARAPFDTPLTIEGFVEQLIALLDAEGIDQAVFVGHSLGTLVLQVLAVAHPGRVSALALVAPVRAANEDGRQKTRDRASKVRAEGMGPLTDHLLTGALSAHTCENNLTAVAFVREVLLRQDAEGYAQTCEASAAAPSPDVAMIRCPTLLLAGEADAARPAAESLAAAIPGATLSVIADSGHWITVEQPEQVNAALTAWLSTQQLPA